MSFKAIGVKTFHHSTFNITSDRFGLFNLKLNLKRQCINIPNTKYLNVVGSLVKIIAKLHKWKTNTHSHAIYLNK